MCKTKLLPVWVRHLGNGRRTSGWSRNSRSYRNRSTNDEDMAQCRLGGVGPVHFHHASTRRIFESAIGFKAVAGVWEVSHKYLGLVKVRLDDLVENPAWRQQTGSSIPDRCLMVLRIERTSGGRRRPEKHVGNIGNHSGKLLPVWVRHLGNRRWTTGWSRNSRPFRQTTKI